MGRIFGPKMDFGARGPREDARNRLQMVSGCVWGVRGALARVSALSELENLQNMTEIKCLGANPLLCLSWAIGEKVLILVFFHDFFENFEFFGF